MHHCLRKVGTVRLWGWVTMGIALHGILIFCWPVRRALKRGPRVLVMKNAYAIIVLVGLAGTVAVGCREDGGPDQGRQEMEDACALGYGACRNNCDKKALGASCRLCCYQKNVACLTAGDYGFEACIQ
jgi:hypothetical protein